MREVHCFIDANSDQPYDGLAYGGSLGIGDSWSEGNDGIGWGGYRGRGWIVSAEYFGDKRDPTISRIHY
jgi:hypothetical protein